MSRPVKMGEVAVFSRIDGSPLTHEQALRARVSGGFIGQDRLTALLMFCRRMPESEAYDFWHVPCTGPISRLHSADELVTEEVEYLLNKYPRRQP